MNRETDIIRKEIQDEQRKRKEYQDKIAREKEENEKMIEELRKWELQEKALLQQLEE